MDKYYYNPKTCKYEKIKKTKNCYNVFHCPAMVPKSIKNAPRTTPEAPKLSPK